MIVNSPRGMTIIAYRGPKWVSIIDTLMWNELHEEAYDTIVAQVRMVYMLWNNTQNFVHEQWYDPILARQAQKRAI